MTINDLERENAKVGITKARGIIFDMDGTLLDSQTAHYRSWDKMTRENGYPHSRHEIIAHFGKTTAAITAALCNTIDPVKIKHLSKLKELYFLDEIPGLVLFDRVYEVLDALKKSGKVICIASSNDNRAIEKIIENLGLHMFVDSIVGLDDVKNGKPNPEMIVTGASRLCVRPDECIVVGDTVYDMQAGKAACCFNIGVLTGNFSHDQLIAAGANAVLLNVGQILDLVKMQT